jgi:hypothetical protein
MDGPGESQRSNAVLEFLLQLSLFVAFSSEALRYEPIRTLQLRPTGRARKNPMDYSAIFGLPLQSASLSGQNSILPR